MKNELNLEKIIELVYKDPKLFFKTDLEFTIVEKFLGLLTALGNNELETGEYFNTKTALENELLEEVIDTGMLFDFEEEVYGYTELELILGLEDEEDSASELKESMSKLEEVLFFDILFNVDSLDILQKQQTEIGSLPKKEQVEKSENLVSNFATVVLEGVIDFYNNEIDYREAVDKLEQLGYSFDSLVNKQIDSVELVELVTMFNLDYDKLLEWRRR